MILIIKSNNSKYDKIIYFYRTLKLNYNCPLEYHLKNIEYYWITYKNINITGEDALQKK